MDSLITAAARALAPCDVLGALSHRSSLPWMSFVEWPGPTASTVTTAPAHSTTAVRNVGERIVQSTMTVAFSLRRTGLPSCDRLGPDIEW
jgi:hypothetical protein